MTLIHIFVRNQHMACKRQKMRWCFCLPWTNPYAIPELNPIMLSIVLSSSSLSSQWCSYVFVIISTFQCLDLDPVLPCRTWTTIIPFSFSADQCVVQTSVVVFGFVPAPPASNLQTIINIGVITEVNGAAQHRFTKQMPLSTASFGRVVCLHVCETHARRSPQLSSLSKCTDINFIWPDCNASTRRAVSLMSDHGNFFFPPAF